MAGSSLDELLETRRATRAALADTRAQLGRARRQVRAEALVWVLPPPLQRAVVAMYQLAGVAEPVVQYLRACGRERHWPERPECELVALVEDLFLQTDADDVAALVDPSHPADPAALKVAYRYLQEWETVAWARDLNTRRGIAPTNWSLLRRADQARLQVPEAFRQAPAGPAGEMRGRRVVRRLRQRWGGRHAAIAAGEHVTAEDMRAKVPDEVAPEFATAPSRNTIQGGQNAVSERDRQAVSN